MSSFHCVASAIVAGSCKMDAITIVIPVFNEEESIKECVFNLRAFMAAAPYLVEYVIVDDGSTDRTRDILQSLGVSYVSHPARRGYGAALKTGIGRSSHDLVCIIDADNQFFFYDICRLAAFAQDFDMVVGARCGVLVRRPPGHHVIAKKFVSCLLGWIFGREVPDINSGFRIFNKAVLVPYLSALCEGFSFTASITLLMLLDNRKIKYVPVSYAVRRGSCSKVRAIPYTWVFITSYVKIVWERIRK